MAIKKKREKRNDRNTLLKRAMKIKCCYCLNKDTCIYKGRKEKSENVGLNTYCTLTPNRLLKKKKKKKNKY